MVLSVLSALGNSTPMSTAIRLAPASPSLALHHQLSEPQVQRGRVARQKRLRRADKKHTGTHGLVIAMVIITRCFEWRCS